MIKVTFACILIEFLTVLCLQSNNSSERAMNTNTQDMKLPFVQLSLNQTAPDAGKPNVTNLYDRDGISAKQNPPKTNPLFLSIMDTIFKRYNVRLVSKKPNEANVYIKKPDDGLCNPGLIAYSAIMNDQFVKLWNSLLDKNYNTLAVLEFNELPKYNNSISDKINSLELQIKKLVVQGLQNMNIVNYSLNLCKMSFEFEFFVPKLDATGLYTAHGMIDGKQFNGNGNLSISLDEVRVSAKSSMDCDVKKYPEHICEFVEDPYKKMNLTVKSAKENVSGIKYDNMTNSQINKAINNFFNQHLVDSSNHSLVRKIVDVTVFKSNLVVNLSPARLMEKLNSFMNWVPQKLRKSGAKSSMEVCGLFCSRH